jgi:hypothetical protein
LNGSFLHRNVRRRLRQICTVLAVLALAVPTALRGENRILFIGNSFTQGSSDASERAAAMGGVPAIFDRLARAGGHTNLTTVMRAVGGQDFQFHDGDATTQATINSQPWTHVVLQNYSTEPTHIVDGTHSVADHYTYGVDLYRRAMTNNPLTKVMLYETWSRAAAHSLITGVSTPSSFASTTQFQTELRTNYAGLADYLNAAYPTNPPVTAAPVGDAWEYAGGLLATSDPQFVDTFASDNYHGNDNGYYLAAAVFYSKIYGASPHGLSTNTQVSSLNLNLTVSATFLEDVAWLTVTGSNQPSPVLLVRQPASQTVTEFQPVTFVVAAHGDAPLFYAWFSNSLPITGATQANYTIPSATTNMSGSWFSVTVSNATSSATSSNAVLTVLSAPANSGQLQTFLFDFGGANTTEFGPSPDDPSNHWNNITTTIGGTSSGQLTNLVTSQNIFTSLGLAMTSRFNGANENGTLVFAALPPDATRDSLFGNTEVFSSLANIFPAFKITGLNPSLTCKFTFYASRTGVSDNRETGYTVTGANSGFAALNVANNVTNTATVLGIRPNASGEIIVSLAPTANNNNANHFTYLGVMRLDAVAVPLVFLPPFIDHGQVVLSWTGNGQLEWATSVLGPWTSITPAPVSPYSEAVLPNQSRFFRLKQ